jgi:hypothetical protein
MSGWTTSFLSIVECSRMFAVTMGDSADDLDPARLDMRHPRALGVEILVGGKAGTDRGRRCGRLAMTSGEGSG